MTAFGIASTVATVYLSVIAMLVAGLGIPRVVLFQPAWVAFASAFGPALALWVAVFFLARL